VLSQLCSRLTYANVMASVAVFIALGGTSYGLATGSIGSGEIKDNTIRSKDIRNNEVRSKDVRDRSLLARDFKAGQLPAGPQGATGATGPGGPRGLTGPTGPPGPTAGFHDGILNAEPPTNPLAFFNDTVTTTTQGRLWVQAYFGPRAVLTCGATACNSRLGLFVNDQPLEDSGAALSGGAGETVSGAFQLSGITEVLPPGTYTLAVKQANSANASCCGGGQAATIDAILLGE
jgi:hypothetical protein